MKREIAVVLSALALVVSLVVSLVPAVPVIADASYEEFTEARSGNVESANDVTSITVAKPGDTVEGDLLIGVVITDGDTSGEFTEPTNWSLINEGWSGAGDYGGCTLGAWYRIAGDSEPATYTWAWTTAETVYAFIIRITGHDPDNPIDVWGFNTAADGFLVTAPILPPPSLTLWFCRFLVTIHVMLGMPTILMNILVSLLKVADPTVKLGPKGTALVVPLMQLKQLPVPPAQQISRLSRAKVTGRGGRLP